MGAGFQLRYRVDTNRRRLVGEALDASRFLAASEKGSVDVWEMREGAGEPSIRSLVPPVHLPATLTADGRHLISSAGGTKLLVRDAGTGAVLQTIAAPSAPVAIQVGIDGDVFLVLHENGLLRFFETATGNIIGSIDGEGAGVVACPDVAYVLLTSGDVGEMRTRDGERVARLDGLGDLLEAKIARGGRRIVGLVDDESSVRLRIWDGLTGRPVFAVDDAVTAAVSADGAFVAVALVGGVVEIRGLASGKVVFSIAADPIAVSSISFCPRGGRIATIGTEGVARIWDWHAGILTAELRLPQDGPAPDPYAQVVFSNTGGALSAGTDRWRAVWNMAGDAAEPHHYDAIAATYDGLWSSKVMPLHRFATEVMRIAPGDRVLDLACGTGSLTVEMATLSGTGEVVGVDPSRGMLEAGHRLAVAAGRRITLVQAKAEDFVATGTTGTFDAISLRFALDYFDWKSVLPTIASLTRPGGRLVVVSSLRSSAPQLWDLYRKLTSSFGADVESPSSVPETIGPLCDAMVSAGLEITDSTTWTTRLQFASGVEATSWLVRSGYISHPVLTGEIMEALTPMIAAGLEENRTAGGVPLDLVIGCVAGVRPADELSARPAAAPGVRRAAG